MNKSYFTPQFHARVFSRGFLGNLLASITAKILQCGELLTFMQICGDVFRTCEYHREKYPTMELGGKTTDRVDEFKTMLVVHYLQLISRIILLLRKGFPHSSLKYFHRKYEQLMISLMIPFRTPCFLEANTCSELN